MCPVENQQWRDIGGGMRVADEYGANTEFMSKMLRKCGLGAIRPPTSERCNTDCINSGNWPRNLSNVPNCICRNCDNDNGNDDGNDNNNNNNNNNNNGNDGKPGEPSTERSQEEPESSR